MPALRKMRYELAILQSRDARFKRRVRGKPFTNATELGMVAKVFQQDVFNMCRVQEGLETTRKPGITLANYQEAKVRWIHKKLGEYITSEETPKSKGDQ